MGAILIEDKVSKSEGWDGSLFFIFGAQKIRARVACLKEGQPDHPILLCILYSVWLKKNEKGGGRPFGRFRVVCFILRSVVLGFLQEVLSRLA